MKLQGGRRIPGRSGAYLEEDGIALYWSYRRASDVFHTAATVWATVRATGLLERLWTGA
jgi:hypothetical protein